MLLTVQLDSISKGVKTVASDIHAGRTEQIDLAQRVDKPSAPALPPPLPVWEPNPNIPLDADLQKYAELKAAEIGIDVNILYRLMYRESRFQIDAWCMDTNGYESIGLCQINGITYSWLEKRGIDPTTPKGNIAAACELIGHYLERYTMVEALAAYGAGETGMLSGRGLESAQLLMDGVVV